MKKIRSYVMLSLLVSSLGAQSSIALADSLEDTNSSAHKLNEITQTQQTESLESNNSTENSENKPDSEGTGESSDTPSTPSVEKPGETVENVPNKKPTKPTENKPTQDPPIVSPNETEKESEQVTASLPTTSGVVNLDIPFHVSVTKTTQEFINEIGEVARKIGQEKNLYASVMIAQAILESGSGQSQLASAPNFNLFGIKGSYQGQSVQFSTQEDNGAGQMYTIQASFRKYPSIKESLEDYAQLLIAGLPNNPSFYRGATKAQAKTYQEATRFLTGKYATDTRYDEKLNKIIETYDLTYFDQEKPTSNRRVVQGAEMPSYAVMNPETKQVSDFIIPLAQHFAISSPYGYRDSDHHDGIDLAVATGTPILASSDGEVVQTGFDPSAGNFVILHHNNGLYSNYFHLSEINVHSNDSVQAGQVIGHVGSTGNSTGPHLHFGMSTKVWGGYLDPSVYLSFNG